MAPSAPTATPDSHPWPRPVCALTLIYAAGIFAGRMIAGAIPQLWLLGAACGLLACQVPGFFRGRLRTPVLPALVFFSLGALTGQIATPPLPAPPSLTPFLQRPDMLYLAEVASTPEPGPDRIKIPLRLHRVYADNTSTALQGGVIVNLRQCSKVWFQGDLLLARLTLNPIRGFHNPGSYDYQLAQAEQGFYAAASAADDRFLVKVSQSAEDSRHPLSSAGTWVRPVDRFRLDAFAWLENHLPPDQASIYGALLLGYRRQVSDFWQEQWNRAGVTHLLSISGQHLGLVALGAFWLIRRGCRFRPGLLERFSDQQMALWVALLLALLYALIGGMSLPTWRSAIMLTLFFASLSLYRQPDLPSALAFSALVILLLQPFSLWSPSFQLSYASLLGIFLLYPRLTPLRTALANTLSGLFRALPGRWWSAFSRIKPWVWRVPRLFAEAFWVSVAANIMVLPLVAFHFYGISLAGFVANTLLVPLFGFITLPLGLFSLVLFSINQWLGVPSLILGGWSLALGNWLVLFFSRLSWAYYWVGKIPVLSLLAFYGAMAIILTSWGWRRKALGAGLGMLGLAAGWLCFNALMPRDPLETAWSNAAPGSLQVLVADVGQGSSTLVRFPGGTTMLVDGGGFYDDSFDIGRSVLAPLLWQLGIRALDVVVLSHDHPDHRNGLRFILSHFEVGCFWESGIEDDSEPSAKLRTIAEKRAIPVRQASEVVKEHPVGPCRLQVLHPAPGYLQRHPHKRDLNNLSLVLQIDCEDTHAIIPGDIDQSVEQLLFAEANLAGKVLLVSPHHGSQHSNSPLLLERLHPDAVLFSSGHANRFGFPHKDVVTRYRERSTPCYRTDLQGAILGISDGTGWKILTERALGGEGPRPRGPNGEIWR